MFGTNIWMLFFCIIGLLCIYCFILYSLLVEINSPIVLCVYGSRKFFFLLELKYPTKIPSFYFKVIYLNKLSKIWGYVLRRNWCSVRGIKKTKLIIDVNFCSHLQLRSYQQGMWYKFWLIWFSAENLIIFSINHSHHKFPTFALSGHLLHWSQYFRTLL